jgi:hypothetical protein
VDIRIQEIVARMQVVDGDALLTPQLLARIVAAVSQAMAAGEADARSRRRDTQVGAGHDCGCGGDDAGGGAR